MMIVDIPATLPRLTPMMTQVTSVITLAYLKDKRWCVAFSMITATASYGAIPIAASIYMAAAKEHNTTARIMRITLTKVGSSSEVAMLCVNK